MVSFLRYRSYLRYSTYRFVSLGGGGGWTHSSLSVFIFQSTMYVGQVNEAPSSRYLASVLCIHIAPSRWHYTLQSTQTKPNQTIRRKRTRMTFFLSLSLLTCMYLLSSFCSIDQSRMWYRFDSITGTGTGQPITLNITKKKPVIPTTVRQRIPRPRWPSDANNEPPPPPTNSSIDRFSVQSDDQYNNVPSMGMYRSIFTRLHRPFFTFSIPQTKPRGNLYLSIVWPFGTIWREGKKKLAFVVFYGVGGLRYLTVGR